MQWKGDWTGRLSVNYLQLQGKRIRKGKGHLPFPFLSCFLVVFAHDSGGISRFQASVRRHALVGRAEAEPPPPRCRKGVNSPYLPACPFQAPGDPAESTPVGEPNHFVIRRNFIKVDHIQKSLPPFWLSHPGARSQGQIPDFRFEFLR